MLSYVAAIVAAGAAVFIAIAAVQELPRIGDISVRDCSPGMEVHVDELCRIVVGGREETFRVDANGAYPPSQSELRDDTAKVDWLQFGVTFQAVRISEARGMWRIEVAGEWKNVGGHEGYFCAIGDELRPGEFCVERQTGTQFRVYATDQLYAGDNRESYPDGHAVLFYMPEEIAAGKAPGRLNDEKVMHKRFTAEMIPDTKNWRIVDVGNDGSDE